MNAFFQKHREKLVPAIALTLAVVAIAIFRAPLLAWFAPERAPTSAAGHVHGAAPAASSSPQAPGASAEAGLPRTSLDPGTLGSAQIAYAAYEEIREKLARDTLDGVAAAARRAEHAAHAAAQSVENAPRVKETLDAAASAAQRLSKASEIGVARRAFGDLSRSLLLLASADRRLANDKHVFECPMAEGYKKWIQPPGRMENPYMGEKMLQCGSESDFPSDRAARESPEHAEHAPGADAVAHYTCPMHPSVKRAEPGKCPICGMDLVAVTKHELETGVIFVDAARRQLIGVKTAKVDKQKLEKTIRTVGKITYDETRIVEVTLKFQGFIGKLMASSTGQRVKKGHTLFTVYGPEVYQAQQDLLIARASTGSQSGALLESAKRRLELWDVPRGTIRRVLDEGQPMRYVPIVSPASGFIVEKQVFEGSAVEPGMRLMRIANLDKVWIEAELYEAELPLVEVGQPATVSLSYLPEGRSITGKVAFIYPYLSGETRTGRVRIELDNKGIELKPDMYANVEMKLDRGERLVVPDSAVIYAGPRRLVFIDLGEGKLRPQEIQVGIKTGDVYEVLSGLHEGDRVVTSGNFLIAAESRLKSATGQW